MNYCKHCGDSLILVSAIGRPPKVLVPAPATANVQVLICPRIYALAKQRSVERDFRPVTHKDIQ